MAQVSGTELIFWCAALAGTLFFGLRAAALVIGGFGMDMDAGHGGAADTGHGHADAAHAHHSDSLQASETAFKLVSINSITGFFMMFGWAGLAATKQFHLGPAGSFLAAFGAGTAAMAATAWLFQAMLRLNSAGARFAAQELVGLDASVYMKIPADGRGKIQVVLRNFTRYVDAVSEDKVDIDSFQGVKVVRALDPRTVSVRKN
jgi:hypothetical protein